MDRLGMGSIPRAHRPKRSFRIESRRNRTRCSCRFVSSRKVSISLRNQDERFPPHAYLKDSERVVHITFPDKRRKKPLGEGRWHVRLLPMQLLWIEFSAVCVIRAWYDERYNGLRLVVSDLNLEGVPSELAVSDTLQLDVDGRLVAREQIKGRGTLDGDIQLELRAPMLPVALAFAPGFQGIVQSILDGVLERLERSIVREIGSDYACWVNEQRSRPLISTDASKRETKST